MPLPCVEELEEEKNSYNQAVSQAVVEVVRKGVEEERVTCGIPQCVELIARGPENVMLCLLVQLSATLDAAIKIPLLLIRAFCQENDINLLHVLGENKMTQLVSACLTQSPKPGVEVTRMATPIQEGSGSNVGCIMIKYPKHDTSVEDDMVTDYVKQKMKNCTDPSVAIPDLSQAGMDQKMGFKLKKKKMKTQFRPLPIPPPSSPPPLPSVPVGLNESVRYFLLYRPAVAFTEWLVTPAFHGVHRPSSIRSCLQNGFTVFLPVFLPV